MLPAEPALERQFMLPVVGWRNELVLLLSRTKPKEDNMLVVHFPQGLLNSRVHCTTTPTAET